jgi:hypothetical protein
MPIETQREGELLDRWLGFKYIATDDPALYDDTLLRRCHVDAMTLEKHRQASLLSIH